MAAIIQIQTLAQEVAIARFFAQTRKDDPYRLEDDPPEPDARIVQAGIGPRPSRSIGRSRQADRRLVSKTVDG